MKMTSEAFHKLIIEKAESGALPAMVEATRVACKYRTEDGRACVVGLTIPDEIYRPEMDKTGTAYFLYSKFPNLFDFIPEGMSITDMGHLQSIHDLNASCGWNKKKFVDSINKFFANRK